MAGIACETYPRMKQGPCDRATRCLSGDLACTCSPLPGLGGFSVSIPAIMTLTLSLIPTPILASVIATGAVLRAGPDGLQQWWLCAVL